MDLSQVSRTEVLLLICRAIEAEKNESGFNDPMAALCLERLTSIASEEDKGWITRKKRMPEQVHLDGSLVLVVGSEGGGMRPLVRKSCDQLLRLPMRGKVESLNAAVADSIALYLAWQARGDMIGTSN